MARERSEKGPRTEPPRKAQRRPDYAEASSVPPWPGLSSRTAARPDLIDRPSGRALRSAPEIGGSSLPIRDADDDLDDSEYPDEPDDDDSAETIPCPYCREPVYEEAQRCPHCGSYVSTKDTPSRRPWWLIVGVVACLAVVLRWVGLW